MSGCSRLTGGGSAVTPLTLSSPTKASLFPIILWRCLAGSEHGIAQPRPHDLRWVVRRAADLKGQLSRSNTLSSGRRGARHPLLCAGRYTLRHALRGCREATYPRISCRGTRADCHFAARQGVEV